MFNKICFDKVSFGYKKDVPVFKDITFTIERTQKRGHIVGLMGDSGSGKSTLFKLLLGTEKAWSGNIEIVADSPIISYVPQEPVLFEHLNPIKNARYFSETIRYKESLKDERFTDMMATLGMKELLKVARSIDEISGGQKQRIALIRALSIQSDILLLDEPLTGLDEKIKDSFLTTIALLANKYNLLVIYITHHRREVEQIADEIMFLMKEENKDYVSEIGLYRTTNFFNIPPTVSSLYLSKELDTNIIKIKINSKNMITLCGNELTDNFYHISADSNNISFQSQDGWEYKICAETDKYLFVQLCDDETVLTLPIFMQNFINGNKYLFLSGEINFYQHGKYFKTINVLNNKIID